MRLVAFARSFVPAALLAACSKDPQIVSRTITAHAPAACAPSPTAYALFTAEGDFDPPAQQGIVLATAGVSLASLPDTTRALYVDVSDEANTFWGTRVLPPTGNVDVLLWPALSPCALTGDVGSRAGPFLGVLPGEKMLVAGGIANPVPGTFVVDLSTGQLTQLPNGLLTPRTRATATPFGQGGLVAGGAGADGTILQSAEVYDPKIGDFDRPPITLSTPRADHGAVVLATGETLLVGGTGADGSLLNSLEIVDPVTGPRTSGLAQLAYPRKDPTVLRLASGEILVAGGVDTQGAPVQMLEWFASNALPSPRQPQPLIGQSQQAFIALPAGGALAVVAPDAGSPPIQNVWVIGADGTPDPAVATTAPLGNVALFAGADGAPILYTGTAWLRWQPWVGSFAPLGAPDDAPGPGSAPSLSAETGLALWLAPGMSATDVVGLRFDTRGDYSPVIPSLLAADTQFTAPDRLVLPGLPSIQFDPTDGVALAEGASVFVTDATYAAFTLDVDAPTGAPAIVVLRDQEGNELEVGGSSCPLPNATLPTIHLTRAGAAVDVEGSPTTCSVSAAARLSVGVRGAPSGSVARNLRIVRHD